MSHLARLPLPLKGSLRDEGQSDYLSVHKIGVPRFGFYFPDWVVVQRTAPGEVYWIVKTKGRIWKGTAVKGTSIRDRCQRITEQTRQRWAFARVNQNALGK